MTSKKSEWNSQEQEELEDDASFDYRQRVETERYNQINRLGYYAY
jgi:hypothetical protein